MEPTSPSKKAVGRFGFGFTFALIAVCLTFLPGLSAADQSDEEATAILTTGQWRIMEAGRISMRIFNPDGTFTATENRVFGISRTIGPAPVDQGPGEWKIANGKVILKFSDHDVEQEILLPINERFARCLDEHGSPLMMVNVLSMGPQAAPVNPGTNSRFARNTPAPLPTPSAAPSISAEEQHSASQVIQTYHNSLVFVNGREGSGSGFIAAMSGANYLITNAHVVAELHDTAFKALDGTVVRGDPASLAVGEDIYCMALPAGGKPFEIMQGVDANAAIGDDVVVLGNAEGAGVVNTIVGKIVGIGPNLVEIDAPFVPGNSGSPIIHLKTGKVIAVATYTITKQYDLTTDKKLNEPVIRRFGYRLDSIKGWQPVNLQAFSTQATEMQNITTLTDDLYDFFRDLDEHRGRLTVGRHTNPILKNRIDEWMEAKGHNHSEEDKIEADANFLSFLKIACQTDVTAAQRQISYDYFRRELADQEQVRGEMAKAFEELLKDVQD